MKITDLSLLILILKAMYKSRWNYLIYGPRARNKRSYHRWVFPLIILLLGVLGWGLIFLTSASIFSGSANSTYFKEAPDKQVFASAILLLLFVYLSLNKILRSVIYLLSPSASLLAISPVSPVAIFLATVLEGPLFKIILLMLGLLVIICAYCIISPFSWGIYIALIIILPLYLSLSLALRSVLSILFRAVNLKRIIYAQRVVSWLIFLAILIGLAVFAHYVSVAVYKLILDTSQALVQIQSSIILNRLILLLGKIGFAFPPSNWAAKSLVAAINGDITNSLKGILPLILLSCVVWAGTIFLVKTSLDKKSIFCSHEIIIKAPITANKKQRFLQRLGNILSPDLYAVVVKDISLIVRQKELLFKNVITSILVVFVIIGALSGINSVHVMPLFVPLFYYLVFIGLTGFIFAATILPLISIDSEGKNFYLFQASPVSIGRVLTAKFCIFCVLVLSIIDPITLVAGLWLQFSAGQIVISLILNSVMVISICGISFGMAAIFPRFDWEVSSQAGSSFLSIYTRQLLMQVYILAVGCIGFFSIERHIGETFGFRPLFSLPSYLNWLIAGLLFLGLNLLATFIPLRLGASKLQIIYDKSYRSL